MGTHDWGRFDGKKVADNSDSTKKKWSDHSNREDLSPGGGESSRFPSKGTTVLVQGETLWLERNPPYPILAHDLQKKSDEKPTEMGGKDLSTFEKAKNLKKGVGTP